MSDPCTPSAWLALGELRANQGDRLGALQAWFQAVTRAQRAGQWLDSATTPSDQLDAVVHAIEQVRSRRRELYFGAYADLRRSHGADALARVDRALSAHLRESDGRPTDPRQRPRFFYFPELPSQPYLDPYAQPWARVVEDAYPAIRDEAIGLLREQSGPFEDFIRVRPGDRIDNYLGGVNPAWEAFFFYRHGSRYDANHARCPVTSRVLDSVELCHIADHAPEICFSILKPGTHLLPHHGVTNVRVVMHLPLVVPAHCALNLVGVGEHHWREGELMMFDDTYRHEAWNRSDDIRVILLLDCWNPTLTDVERQAMTKLIETIGALHIAARAAK